MGMMMISGRWRWGGRQVYEAAPSFALPYFTTTRKRIEFLKVSKVYMSDSKPKRANLSAAKKERIKLPNYDDVGKAYHISQFLNQPSGIEAILNTSSLQSFQLLDTNTYRCTLPKFTLLNFEAAPTLDLRVIPTNENCTVEMLACRFEGSEIVEQQNELFSAFMQNHMTWNISDSELFLEIDVKLNLSLEIYTRPFSLLPVSVVEHPGNLMMQALVDRLVPALVQQLLHDYDKWIQQQRQSVP